MKIFIRIMLLSFLAVPAYAGQATIVETDTAIIVEYSGSEDDRQATVRQQEERERKQAEEKRKAELKKASADRRAEARKASEEE